MHKGDSFSILILDFPFSSKCGRGVFGSEVSFTLVFWVLFYICCFLFFLGGGILTGVCCSSSTSSVHSPLTD